MRSDYAYIMVMQHANITFLSNVCTDDLIVSNKVNNDDNNPFPFCVFQYASIKRNPSAITAKDYTIKFAKNVQIFSIISPQCMLSFDRYTSHCKWLPTSVFYGHRPGLINQQIIKNDQKPINNHTFICILSSTFQYDCATDTLGPVYPGQIL